MAADPAAPKAPFDRRLIGLVEKCWGSIATVKADGRVGAGFFVTTDGFFITPYALVSGAREVTVNEKTGAIVHSVDLINGLALLKIKSESVAAALELEVPFSANVGDDVLAVAPRVRGRALERGVSLGKIVDLTLKTTAAINPAYAGSPVLNSAGKVVGIAVAKDGDEASLGRAVRADAIKALLDGRDGDFRVEGSLAEWEMKRRLGGKLTIDPTKAIVLDSLIQRWIVDEDNDRILALDGASNSLLLLSISERKVVRKVSTGPEPSALCMVPSTSKGVWVGNKGSPNVVRIDLEKGVVTETIALSSAPVQLVAVRKHLWIVGSGGGLSGIDTSDKKDLGLVTGSNYLAVAYDSKKDRLWAMDGQWVTDFDAAKLGPLQRELTRQNLTDKQRAELQQAFAQFKGYHSVALAPQGKLRVAGVGFLFDDKGGKLYANLKSAKVDKPDALSTFKVQPHSMEKDAAIVAFSRQNPYLDDFLALSPDGKWIATGTHVHNTTTLAIQKEIPLPTNLVAFSKDSRRLYYFDWVNRAILTVDLEPK